MWGVMIRYYMDYNPIFPLIFMGAAAIKAHTHSGSKFQYVTSTTMSEQILEVLNGPKGKCDLVIFIKNCGSDTGTVGRSDAITDIGVCIKEEEPVGEDDEGRGGDGDLHLPPRRKQAFQQRCLRNHLLQSNVTTAHYVRNRRSVREMESYFNVREKETGNWESRKSETEVLET
nr:hypothetical protein Iba_chr08aCG6580 [Ipomoea batatas]GMD26717.1 hypothetical protein Iba_chr08dCG6930 [Ipomoea batatas]